MRDAADYKKPLTFRQLAEANLRRTEAIFHPLHAWSPTDWATAMAGECGEACNLIKKLRRGERVPSERIGEELADMVIYADLLAQRLGIDLGEAVIKKFDQDSSKFDYPVPLRGVGDDDALYPPTRNIARAKAIEEHWANPESEAY